MPFQHACFISYRHGQRELMKRFIEDFYEALSSELEPLIDPLRVYRDILRLQGGDFYNQALARNLCESVCMIMIFTPTYFDTRHSYCTREYLAMKKLESSRLARTSGDRVHGLIIPVVLRDFDQLPAEIKDERQVYRFEQFTVADQKMIRDRRYAADIRKIAAYVADRCRELRSVEPGCDDFRLPDDDVARAFAGRVSALAPSFPGRSN